MKNFNHMAYYCHAFVFGMLAGVGCNTIFGGIGGVIVAIIIGTWGVTSAIKVYGIEE